MSTEEFGAPTAPTATESVEQAVLDEVEALVDPLEGELDMDPLDRRRRLLVVHAHPDDESIECGATMARYAADGVGVTLVTCTQGEEGEVVSDVADELGHLTSDRDDALGPHRVGELAAAMEALGVSEHRFLGGPGRYRDSGMAGTPTVERDGCFALADVDEVALELVSVIREIRPQVLIAPASDGGYGHPDHVMAHRVAVRAVQLSADAAAAPERGEPWQVSCVYTTIQPRGAMEERTEALRNAEHPFDVVEPDALPFVVPDELVTTVIDGTHLLAAQLAALRAHATQVRTRGVYFALSNDIARLADGWEHFRLILGGLGPVRDAQGHENDLFSGLG